MGLLKQLHTSHKLQQACESRQLGPLPGTNLIRSRRCAPRDSGADPMGLQSTIYEVPPEMPNLQLTRQQNQVHLSKHLGKWPVWKMRVCAAANDLVLVVIRTQFANLQNFDLPMKWWFANILQNFIRAGIAGELAQRLVRRMG
jgi:hypothetical protein